MVDFNEESSDEDNPHEHHLTITKEDFRGMKIYDEINPSKKNNYFQIFINNKRYYLHKQTAANLLTVNKNRLSSDRCLRVQQAGRQQ